MLLNFFFCHVVDALELNCSSANDGIEFWFESLELVLSIEYFLLQSRKIFFDRCYNHFYTCWGHGSGCFVHISNVSFIMGVVSRDKGTGGCLSTFLMYSIDL